MEIIKIALFIDLVLILLIVFASSDVPVPISSLLLVLLGIAGWLLLF